jgi:hypothetical protein
MEPIPIGPDADRRDMNQALSLFDVPAYIRRARGVEEALEHLVARGRRQRDEWLLMTRLRLGQLRALAGAWEALRPWLADDDQLAVLEEMWTQLTPRLRLPPEPTTSPRRLRTALVELLGSVERFNTRWRAYLDKVDPRPVNDLRENYNRYYVLEKSCALRSDVLARVHFTPLPMLDLAEVERLLPLLPVLRLAS